MTRLITALLLFGAPAIGLTGCGSSPSPEAVAAATHKANYTVTGMTCSSCELTIRTAVNKVEGVGTVPVDAEAGPAEVTFDASKVSAAEIADAISATGYNAVVTSSEGV